MPRPKSVNIGNQTLGLNKQFKKQVDAIPLARGFRPPLARGVLDWGRRGLLQSRFGSTIRRSPHNEVQVHQDHETGPNPDEPDARDGLNRDCNEGGAPRTPALEHLTTHLVDARRRAGYHVDIPSQRGVERWDREELVRNGEELEKGAGCSRLPAYGVGHQGVYGRRDYPVSRHVDGPRTRARRDA